MADAVKPIRVTSVIASLTAGGIGSVCRYAAEEMARLNHWEVTLLSLHDASEESTDPTSGVRFVCMGLDGNCARLFLDWLSANPQDLLLTSDVSRIEPAFRFLPAATRHVIQIHDSGRRYREVAVRHAAWVDGVTCVGRHIEAPLQRSLDAVGFRGLLRTVHNGANFPPLKERPAYGGPLRLLFMGRVEALKGVFDFVPLLQRLRRLGVPASLKLVGEENEALRHLFQRKGLASGVTWVGSVPHAACYDFAAESDLFMMTSRKEPFGMVTIEAMSMGCVPIAYDVPSGSTEIIEHGKSGLLVRLGDVRACADHIRSLHEERARLVSLSAGALARARTQFNSGVMARNMAGFLVDVMAHSETHPACRETGGPPETPAVYRQPASGYQRLPKGLRVWIRNRVCASPRFSHWLLNR
jgi:glycosyltransferase involved in cell wall biosynthesis